MTPADRIASLFGEIAVAAGVYETVQGRKPTYVVLSPADAAAIRDYLQRSDAAVGYEPRGPLTQTTRNVAQRALVSDLHVIVKNVHAVSVC